MALNLGNLVVTLSANTSGLQQASTEVNNVTNSMTSSFNRVAVAIAAAFSFEAIRRIIIASDQLNVMQRRLVRFTGSTDSAEKTFRKLAQTASNVGQEIGNISSIFERFSLIREDINATNDQIIQMTDTLAKLGAIGGSSSDEINNALRQLAQGLAGGVLRAEEFNSVVEQTPEIARAIREEMGLTFKELRQAMMDGKLTSDRVFNAILASARKTNEEFEKMPKSILQASQALKNELLVAISQIDQEVGFTGRIAEGISLIADKIALLTGNASDFLITQDETTKSAERIIKLKSKELNLESRLSDLRGKAEGSEIVRSSLPFLERSLVITRKLLAEEEKRLEILRFGEREEITIDIEKREPEGPQLVDREEIAKQLEIRAQLTRDANLELEAEMIRHQVAINENFKVGSSEFEQAQVDLNTFRKTRQDEINADELEGTRQLQLDKLAQMQSGLGNVANVFNAANSIIQQGLKEGNAIAKAAFLAMKAIQVAQIIAATEVAAIQAGAATSTGGPFAFLASAAVVRATGFASAGIVAGLSIGEAAGSFEHGGIVPGNSFSGDNMVARVNSGEMIINQGQQKQLFAMANGSGGEGGTPNITLINNGTPQQIEGSSVGRDEITLMINDANRQTVKQIDTSLATGRGSTFASLNKGSRIERRL